MLGHLKPPLCRLQPRAREHYRHLYCSLCYSLRRQFGLPAGLLISHELTIGLLACTDGLAAPLDYRACPVRLFCQRRAVIQHETVNKAARLNLLLVWLKLVDWETDSRKFVGGFFRKIAESRIRRFWPELPVSVREFIDDYLVVIKSSPPDFTVVREKSGLLAKMLFGELTHQRDSAGGNAIALVGEMIPVADALLDFKQDLGKSQYNPVIAASRQQAIPLAQAYHDLRTDYRALAGRVSALLAASENVVFADVLVKSLVGLSARIDRQGYFAGQAGGPNDNYDNYAFRPRRQRRRGGESGWRDCCGDCCCNCCESAGSEVSTSTVCGEGGTCCHCDGCCCDGCGGCGS